MSTLAYLENGAPERRSSPRKKLRLATEDATASGAATEVTVHELTESGILFESDHSLANGEQLEVIIPQFGAVQARVVWCGGRYFGCKFLEQLPKATAVSAESEQRGKTKGSPEALTQASFQLTALSLAIQRLNRVLDRAIDHLSTRKRR